MRIVVKGHDLVAQIVYDAKEDAASSNNNVMGVDLGIKCPAVSYCPEGTTIILEKDFKKLRSQRRLSKSTTKNNVS